MKRVTEQKSNDELPKELINDAEFVALIEKEMQDDETLLAENDLQKKRLWQRLEGSMQPAVAPQPKRPYWAWAAAAAILLLLIPVLQNKPQDQFKGGDTGTQRPMELKLNRENGLIRASLIPFDSAQPYLALVMDAEPFDVLWQGTSQGEDWQVPWQQLRPGRICAIAGKDASEITVKLNLIKDLKQFPDDAPCRVLPLPSE